MKKITIDKWLKAEEQKIHVTASDEGEVYDLGDLSFKTSNGQVSFKWSEQALDLKQEWSPIKLRLSPNLEKPQCSARDFSYLHGIFYHSLPDRWGTKVAPIQYKDTKGMSAGHQYPLFRLACIGKQGIGAFDYHSNIKDIEKTFQQRKNVTLSDIKNQIIKASNSLSSVQDGEILLSGRTLQGAYPKVSLDVSEDGKKFQISDGNNVEGFEPWILKFPHKGKETHPDNDIIFKIEYVYNQMASECGLRVPETKLLDVDGNSVFATKRFDRTPKGKIPMMSLCGMMEIPHSSPSGDYTHVADCLLALKADKAEFHEAFKQMIFNSIFCNRDDHTKNIAFVRQQGKWKISPAYDLTFSTGVMGTHALHYVKNKVKNPSLKNILSLGIFFGIDREDIFVMIDTFAKISNQFVNKAHLLEIEPLVIDKISNDINISIARAKSNKEIVTLQN